MRYILALMIALPLLAVSLEADAGLVEDLRSGKSDVRASSTQGNRSGIISFWRQMRSQPNFKAIASARSRVYAAMGRYSAEAAVEGALQHCKESGGGRTRCEVYAVGDTIVQAHSQRKLADAIEAYQLEVSGSKAATTASGRTFYCKTNDGSVYENSSGCGEFNKKITKTEYDENVYCKGPDGYFWRGPDNYDGCVGWTKITKAEYDRLKIQKDHQRLDRLVKKGLLTQQQAEDKKAEYDRLKNQKKDTATTSKSETVPSGYDPLEAKLEKLKKLLEKGLITEEEAVAKRAKLLEDL